MPAARDPISELVDTLSALRRDVDHLARESAEGRAAIEKAASAAAAAEKAAQTPRAITVDATAVGQALKAVQTSVARLGDQVGALDAAHYRQAVTDALAGARAELARHAEEFGRTLDTTAGNLVRSAESAGTRMSQASHDLSTRIAVVIGAVTGAVLLAAILVTWGSGQVAVLWQESTRDQLGAEIARRRAELADLEARAGDWARRAGRATLNQCGDPANPKLLRLCARIDPKAPPYGAAGEFRILDGY